MLMFIKIFAANRELQPSFNTSYVNVYLSTLSANANIPKCFNTSYVNVYLMLTMELSGSVPCFNTSYVNVYRSVFTFNKTLFQVSIHPMLMFIQRISAISKNNYTNFSSIYQLFSIFYQPITHFIVFK